jgi:hypothetical protein
MTTLSDHGLTIEVPPGWEARLSVPDLPAPAENRPVLHMADLPLGTRRSSYAVETAAAMPTRTGGVVVSLVEFGPELADVGLYAPQGTPRIHRNDLDPRALQFARADQAGVQRFFSIAGRAFSLYVVATMDRRTGDRLAAVNAALGSLRVQPLASGST